MSNSASSILLNLVATAIIAMVVYALSLAYPAMPVELRALLSSLMAIVLVLAWHLAIARVYVRFAPWVVETTQRVRKGWTARLQRVGIQAVRLRAYLGGEMEQMHSDLRLETEKYAAEKANVEQLTLALVTLSDHTLRLFDRRVERPQDLEWGGAMAASEQALECVAAALWHHVTKIIYYDPHYPVSWVGEENAREARNYFVRRFFVEKNAQQLQTWIVEALKSDLAHRSLIVFAQDVVPDTVAEVRNDTCLIRKYLDAGGRVVWRGDIPFWYQGKAGGARDNWHGTDPFECGPWKILGVYYHNYVVKWVAPREGAGTLWGADLPLRTTAAGRDIGLDYPRQGVDIRPAPRDDVDVSYLSLPQEGFRVFGSNQHGSAGEFALSWKKNFNERYPHSGFMQYILGDFVWNDVNDDFFRFAVSGWPLLFDE